MGLPGQLPSCLWSARLVGSWNKRYVVTADAVIVGLIEWLRMEQRLQREQEGT